MRLAVRVPAVLDDMVKPLFGDGDAYVHSRPVRALRHAEHYLERYRVLKIG